MAGEFFEDFSEILHNNKIRFFKLKLIFLALSKFYFLC